MAKSIAKKKTKKHGKKHRKKKHGKKHESAFLFYQLFWCHISGIYLLNCYWTERAANASVAIYIYITKSYINFAFTVSTFRVSGLIRCVCSCVCAHALRSVMPCVHVIEEDAAAFGSFTSAANKSKEGRTIIALSNDHCSLNNGFS